MLKFLKFDQIFENENLEKNQHEQSFWKFTRKKQPVIGQKHYPSVFEMLRLDSETVLILLITTRIPGRFYRTGTRTVVGPCSVDDLRSCAVTSALICGHVHGHDQTLFPVLDRIETEDNKRLPPAPIEVVPQGHAGACQLTTAIMYVYL